MRRRDEGAGAETPVREAMEALYGEGRNDAAVHAADDFVPLRDELREWANEPVDAAARRRMRAAILDAAAGGATADAARVVPVSGMSWLRRGDGTQPVPVSSVTAAAPGGAVLVPDGSRAQIHYADGSLLLLDGGTEIELGVPGAERAAARMARGRLFAWIAPQGVGSFSVRTPRGSVSVLGTEFDLSVSAKGALELLVAGGRVQFAGTGDAAPAPVLTAGHLMSFSNGSPSVRALPAWEMHRRTGWARNGGPAPEKRSRWKWFAAACVVALVGAAWVFREDLGIAGARTSTVGAESAAASAPAKPAQGTATAVPVVFNGDAATFRQPVSPGARKRWRAVSEVSRAGKFVPQSELLFDMNEIEAAPDGTSRVQMTLVDRKTAVPDGAANRQAANGQNSLVGKTTELRTGPGGKVESVLLLGKAAADGTEAFFIGGMAHYSPNRLLPDKPVKPGDEWESRASGAITQHPGATYDFNTRVRYDGVEEKDGRKFARFSFTGTGGFAGITMHAQAIGKQELRVTVGHTLQETGTMRVDTATGAVVGTDSVEKRSSVANKVILAQGRVVLQEPIPSEPEEVRVRTEPVK